MEIISKYRYIFLALIVVLGLSLRFYKISSFPPLNADEAALGYNAWSLIETGLDEHGNAWPIHLQSFNDYKPALYAYILTPFVALGGLDVFLVRIPGTLLGVLNIIIIYLLAKQIVRDKRSELFALSSALFLAVSPWHLHFSRGAWEVNVATFLITLGVYLFFKSLEKPKYFFVSFLSFTLSLYTYHAARVVVPILGLSLIAIFYKECLRLWKHVLVYGFVVVLIVLPLVVDLFGPAGLSRAAGVGIFSDSGPLSEINEQRGEHSNLASLQAKLLHNKVLNYTLAIAENWGEHFSGEFLFLSGDEIQRNRVPEHGQMYMHDIVFVLIGIVAVVKFFNRRWAFILIWLIISPLAASLTFQSPHALRAQNMVIPLVLVSAFGFTYLITWGKEKIMNKYLFISYCLVLISLVMWGFSRYQWLYWKHLPNEYPYSSQYGFEEMINFVMNNSEKYQRVFITDRYDQPYILTLFYTKYPPSEFQRNHTLTDRDGFGFSTVRNFDRYTFSSIGNWSQLQSGFANSLIVGTDEEIPNEANIIKTIYFPNGDIAFQIVAN